MWELTFLQIYSTLVPVLPQSRSPTSISVGRRRASADDVVEEKERENQCGIEFRYGEAGHRREIRAGRRVGLGQVEKDERNRW